MNSCRLKIGFLFTPFLFFLLLSCQSVLAQPDSTRAAQTYRLVLKDGSEILGTIRGQDTISVKFLTISQISMDVPRVQIKSMERLSGTIVDGHFQYSDPNYTHLFIGPTGRPLKNGEGYFSTYEIFFPFVAVGIGEVLTLAGGISLIPGAENQVVYLAPKITPVHLKNLDVSTGLMYFAPTSSGDSKIGVLYAVGTYGSSDAALTAGLGWDLNGRNLTERTMFLVGGELRIAGSVKLISENWIPAGANNMLYSFGFRFFGESLAADLGFFRTTDFKAEGFPFIPWVGFQYSFGSKKN